MRYQTPRSTPSRPKAFSQGLFEARPCYVLITVRHSMLSLSIIKFESQPTPVWCANSYTPIRLSMRPLDTMKRHLVGTYLTIICIFVIVTTVLYIGFVGAPPVQPSGPVTQYDIDGDGVAESVQDNRNLVNATSPDGYETYVDPNGNSVLVRYADGDNDGLVDLLIDTRPDTTAAAHPTVYWDPDNGVITSIAPYNLDADARSEYLVDTDGDSRPDLVFEWDESQVPYRNTPFHRDGYYAAAEWVLNFNIEDGLNAIDWTLASGLNVMQVYAVAFVGPNNPGSTNNQKRWDYYTWFDDVLGNPTASARFRRFVDQAHARGVAVFMSVTHANYDRWWYIGHPESRDMNHEMRRNAVYNQTVQAGSGGSYSMPGASFINNSYSVSLHDLAFRSMKAALFRNLVENYSVDGFKADDGYTFENPYWSWETWMRYGDTRNLWHWEITGAYYRLHGVDPSWNNLTGWAEANSTRWLRYRQEVWSEFVRALWTGAGLNESDMVFGYGDVPVDGNFWRPHGSLNMQTSVYSPQDSFWADTTTGLKRFGVCYRIRPGFETATPTDIDLYGPRSWDDSGKWYYWFGYNDPAPGSAKWYAIGRASMPYWFTLRPFGPDEIAALNVAPSTPVPLALGDADYVTAPLRWLSSLDPNGDRVWYELHVVWINATGQGNVSATTGTNEYGLNTMDGTTYRWSVRATDGNLTSNWSDENQFKDLGSSAPPQPPPGRPPTTPSPLPLDNADYTQVTLRWLAATDPDGDQVSYQLRITWHNYTSAGTFTADTVATFYILDTQDRVTYQWSVRAMDGQLSSNWSEAIIFSDVGPTAPGARNELFGGQLWIVWLMFAGSIAGPIVALLLISKRRRGKEEPAFQCSFCSAVVEESDETCPSCGGTFET